MVFDGRPSGSPGTRNWVPPTELLPADVGRTQPKEAHALFRSCFDHLFGADHLRLILSEVGFLDLAEYQPGAFSWERLLAAVDILQKKAAAVGDADAVLRSVLKLQTFLYHAARESDSVGSDPEAEVFVIETTQDLIRVRDASMRVSKNLGFTLTESVTLATAISELTRNILHYAGTGKVSIRMVPGEAGKRGVEVVAEDKGPGIADLEKILSGHYRSRTGMGLGLVGTKRLLDRFLIETEVGKGTKVTGVKYAH
jgi:serine/threonine-protein kinase RsbT